MNRSAVRPALTSWEESTMRILAAGWGWAAALCAHPQCLWTGLGIDWCPGLQPQSCRCCWRCWCWRWSPMKNMRKGWMWLSPWASRGMGSRLHKGRLSGWCARDAEWWRTVGRNCGHRSGYSSWHGCWTAHRYAVGWEQRERQMRGGRKLRYWKKEKMEKMKKNTIKAILLFFITRCARA